MLCGGESAKDAVRPLELVGILESVEGRNEFLRKAGRSVGYDDCMA